MSERWIWRCRFYYNENAPKGARPGDLAIETVHTTDSSKDMEVAVGRNRKDIGQIDVNPY